MINCYVQKTVIGPVGIYSDEKALLRVSFNFNAEGMELNETPLIKEAFLELGEYFEGKRKVFDLPLFPQGTVFQQKVWDALTNIPYGQTRSYKQIAEIAGNKMAARAVGMANNKNPLPIFIPCHRVIGSDGSLVGFGGGIEIKEKLLALEKQYQ